MFVLKYAFPKGKRFSPTFILGIKELKIVLSFFPSSVKTKSFAMCSPQLSVRIYFSLNDDLSYLINVTRERVSYGLSMLIKSEIDLGPYETKRINIIRSFVDL